MKEYLSFLLWWSQGALVALVIVLMILVLDETKEEV